MSSCRSAAGSTYEEIGKDINQKQNALYWELMGPVFEATRIWMSSSFTANMDRKIVEQSEKNYQRMSRTLRGEVPSKEEMKENVAHELHWDMLPWTLYDVQYSKAHKAEAQEK